MNVLFAINQQINNIMKNLLITSCEFVEKDETIRLTLPSRIHREVNSDYQPSNINKSFPIVWMRPEVEITHLKAYD